MYGDGLGDAIGGWGFFCCGLGVKGSIGAWQEDFDAGTRKLGVMAVEDVNGAAVLLDDAQADPESEPCACFSLGGEEWLEDVLVCACSDAFSAVCDPDEYAGPSEFLCGLGFQVYADAAVAAGGFNGVDEDVGEDLA